MNTLKDQLKTLEWLLVDQQNMQIAVLKTKPDQITDIWLKEIEHRIVVLKGMVSTTKEALRLETLKC